MTQNTNPFDKINKEAANATKAQMDAIMKCGNVLFKGIEDMTQTCISMGQKTTEKNVQAAKAMLACKTLNEWTETQNKWAQQSFDDFMSGTTKLSELSVKIATDSFEPVNDQLSKTIKKATESVAA